MFDPDDLGLKDKGVVEDFPGSSARWQRRPTGISHTIVNGELLIEDGELTGALPGQVIKVGRVAGGQNSSRRVARNFHRTSLFDDPLHKSGRLLDIGEFLRSDLRLVLES